MERRRRYIFRNWWVLSKFDDLSYVNPIKIYRTYRVNYLGAALICIIYNLLCPICSIGYWFYKLCTFGRD